MKKDYEKPLAEIIEFVPEDSIMDDDDFGLGGGPTLGGSGFGDEEDW